MSIADITNYIGKKAYMIGIGGSSMSGLALLLQNMGIIVSGSACDPTDTVLTTVRTGHTSCIGTGINRTRILTADTTHNLITADSRRIGTIEDVSRIITNDTTLIFSRG